MDPKALQNDLQSLGFTPSLAKPDGTAGQQAKHDDSKNGRDASKRSGMGEDERRPVMAQLAAR